MRCIYIACINKTGLTNIGHGGSGIENTIMGVGTLGVEKGTAKNNVISIASLGGGSGRLELGRKKWVGVTEASVGNSLNLVPAVVQTEKISGAGIQTVPGSGRDSYGMNNGNEGKVSGILKINSAS